MFFSPPKDKMLLTEPMHGRGRQKLSENWRVCDYRKGQSHVT
jgi:hypothetical protein